MANGKKQEKIEPLEEDELKKAILALQALNKKYEALDAQYDFLAARVLATMPPRDVRQYGNLRCCVVQMMRRSVDWKKEALGMARRLYPSATEFKRYLFALVKTYKKKAAKPSIKLTVAKTEEKQA
jgi:hypothetical protein